MPGGRATSFAIEEIICPVFLALCKVLGVQKDTPAIPSTKVILPAGAGAGADACPEEPFAP